MWQPPWSMPIPQAPTWPSCPTTPLPHPMMPSPQPQPYMPHPSFGHFNPTMPIPYFPVSPSPTPGPILPDFFQVPMPPATSPPPTFPTTGPVPTQSPAPAQPPANQNSAMSTKALFFVDSVVQCQLCVDQLSTHKELAMDVEGVDLCRNGAIALIQMCTFDGQIVIFDIAALGQDAFNLGGLKALLESQTVCKVIYDGRADADALYHRHGVQLQYAFDLQVQHALRYSSSNDRYVKGLQRCLDDSGVVPLVDKLHVARQKDEGKRLFAKEMGGRPDVWMIRPLPNILIEYAACDVKYLLRIKALWSGPSSNAVFRVTKDRLQGAIRAVAPAKGEHMSVRDFSIGVQAMYLGREAVTKPRCFTCGSTGHMARACPSRTRFDFEDGIDDSVLPPRPRFDFDDYFDDYLLSLARVHPLFGGSNALSGI